MSADGMDFAWLHFAVRHFLEVRMARCFFTLRYGFRQHWKRRSECFSSEVLQIISGFLKLPLGGGHASGQEEVSEKLTVGGMD